MYSVSYEIPWAVRPKKHRFLLDLPVRTDTKGGAGHGPAGHLTPASGGSRGFKGGDSDPFYFVRCTECGSPILSCCCQAGRDY